MIDLFISYAHIDDKPLVEGERGWISHFHHTLSVRLEQLLGRDLNIWRDPKLHGNDLFDEAIVRQFSAAKVLIAILSPRYVKSEWCIREVLEFCRSAGETGGIHVQDKSRLFKVIKTPVSRAEIPDVVVPWFESLLGFEFFDLDPDTGRIREFDETFGALARQRFYEKIYDLAYEISDLLKRFDRAPAGAAPLAADTTGRTVYLAMTTSDLQPERDKIRRELIERGHQVLPDRPLPLVEAELKQAVRQHLARCQFAVHLIGDRYGLIPEDSAHSLVEVQNQLAADRSRETGLERLIWIPKGLTVRDVRQEKFIGELRHNSDSHQGADLIEESIENLKGLIVEKLAPATVEPAIATARNRAAGGPPQLYLICDSRDEPAIEPLEDYLFDQGLEVTTPDFSGDEAEISQMHREKLRWCDGAMIYYGAASRSWVDIKLMDLMQAPGYGRMRPMTAQAVYVAPPNDHRKERYRTHTVEVIRQTDCFNPGCLEPLVKRLSGQR